MEKDLSTHVMSLDDARRVTERIRLQATNVRDGLEKLQQHVDEARDGKAWEVLGYKSWTAYLADVMGDEPLRLSRDERREVVELLAGEGMSIRGIANITGASVGTVHNDQVFNSEHLAGEGMPTRAIASAAGISDGTVRNDIQAGAQFYAPMVHASPDPETQPVQFVPSASSPNSTDAVMAPQHLDLRHEDAGVGITPTQVTGMDGKTYPRTSPDMKPRRHPLPRAFNSALLNVERTAKSLHRFIEDDRWPANKNQVATAYGNDLARAIDLLQEVEKELKSSNQQDKDTRK